jgi:ADP-heptose:LPS heptosyltransferase
MNYIGDALMTTPTLAMLRRSFESPVDVIAGGAAGYAAFEILRGNPDIGQLIARADGGSFARCAQLFRTVSAGSYDLVVVLPSIPPYRWAATLARARQVVYVSPCPGGAHMADHMLRFTSAKLGIEAGPLKMTLHVSDESRETAVSLLGELNESSPLVGLNIGATRAQKLWPTESFQELIRRLHSRGYTTALLGSPDDEAIASRIVAGIDGVAVVDLTGRTAIGEWAAVIERCAAVIAGDTGAMHMAAALEIPVVALFGSTDPAKTGPIGQGKSHVIYKQLQCAPCNNHPTCGGAFTCMSSITPMEVVAAVEHIAGRIAKRPRLQIVSS